MAGIGIYFGHDDPRNVSRRVIGKQSNNTAELTALIDTYPLIADDVRKGLKISIISDSVYAIRCVSTYGKKCADTQWKKAIPNKELVQRAYELYKDLPVKFVHIAAHTGLSDIHSLGNGNFAYYLKFQGRKIRQKAGKPGTDSSVQFMTSSN
jgi:ribonuclease HI